MTARDPDATPPAPGPPPLEPFGLILHHEGRWTHDGVPVTHPRLRDLFDRSVRYLPQDGKYVVQVGQFRGQIEIEEAAWFVRDLDLETGTLLLSDRSREPLDPATLTTSTRDGALLCRVKFEVVPGGGLARFLHGPQSRLFQAVEELEGRTWLCLAGTHHPLPGL